MHLGHFEQSLQFLAAYPELLSHREGILRRYYDVEVVTTSPRRRKDFSARSDELRLQSIYELLQRSGRQPDRPQARTVRLRKGR